MIPLALLLLSGASGEGVRAFEVVVHPGEYLDLDTGLVSNRETFAHARADLRFSVEEESLLWRSGAGRAGPVSPDASFEELVEVGAVAEADSPPVPLEAGTVVLLRTSEGVGGKLRVLGSDRGSPERVDKAGVESPRKGDMAVRLQWALADEPTRFSPGPTGAIARVQPRGVEVSWEDGSRCLVERVDEDTGARAILAKETTSPYLDEEAQEGGFYRYEIARRLGGEALSDRSCLYVVRGEGGMRGEFVVQGSAPRIDLARGAIEGRRHDLSVLSVAVGGAHVAPAPGGAILPFGPDGRTPTEREWVTERPTLLGVGGSLLVRTRDGRHGRVRLLELTREEGKGSGARFAYELLADYGRTFVDPPGDLQASVEAGRVRLRWTHPEAGSGLFRVERARRGEFATAGEVEGTSYEEPAADRLYVSLRVVRRDARGRESLPSAVVSLAVREEGEGERFAERAAASLGSPDHERREEAAAALRSMGDAALDALRRAASSEDPEISERASGILDEIAPATAGGGSAGTEAIVKRFGRVEAERLGLLDSERRLLALLGDALRPAERAFLADRDPDPFLRSVAKSPRFAPDPPLEEGPYAEPSREPYAFDRAAAVRLFDPGRSGAELAEEIARNLTRRPVRDAWLLRTVVDGLRDPSLSDLRRDRAEVALRCLHGRPPGDASAVGAAEAVLGEAFALERARALRAVARGAFAEPGEPTETIEVAGLPALEEALGRAEPGTRIRLRRGEYGGGGALTIRRSGLRIEAAEEGIVLGVPLRIEEAEEVRLEGLSLSTTGAALHAVRSSVLAVRCTFGPAMVGAIADRSEVCFRGCRFEASGGTSGYGLQVQRGSFLVLEGCLVRGFTNGLFLAAPGLVERSVLVGSSAGQAAIQGSADAFLGLVRCAVRGHRSALRLLTAGFASGLALDRVSQPYEGLGSSFLLCAEDRPENRGSGTGGTDAASFSDCEATIRPR